LPLHRFLLQCVVLGTLLLLFFLQGPAAQAQAFPNCDAQGRLSLSGGNMNRNQTYTAPNGTVVYSSAPIWVNSNYYYIGYLFNQTYGTGAVHYWLTDGVGTLTFSFPTAIPMSRVRVYPTLQSDRNSSYTLQYHNGSTWVSLTGNVTRSQIVGSFRDESLISVPSATQYRFVLTQERDYGVTLTEVEFYPNACSPSACPTGGHNVTISNHCTFDAGQYDFTGTLTIDAPVEIASNNGSAPVELNADHIFVTSNGRLDASGRGHGSASGPGYTETPSGAAHGGLAGGEAGVAHGSVTTPVSLGSGGVLASGGGAIILRTPPSGSVTVAGGVFANGVAVSGTCARDGGAGGSILIETGTLGGTGTIAANGGSACTARNSGGGGRLALKYQGLAAGTTVHLTALALGGATPNVAGAGTVYLEAAGVGSLRVENGGVTGGATPQIEASVSYQALTISKGGNYRVASGQTLLISSGATLSGSGSGPPRLEVLSGAKLTSVEPLGTTGLDASLGGLIEAPSLVVENGTWTREASFASTATSLTVGAGGTFTVAGTTPFSMQTVSVLAGGVLTHLENTSTRENVLDLTATTLTIAAGGQINVDGRGYDPGQGPGAGASSGGGSHGGIGSGAGAGAAYGDFRSPSELGSGGFSSGSGGGHVRLNVSTLELLGAVSANGSKATTGATHGGGAGGGIDISATTLLGSGTISANGGAGNASGNPCGGGGRIALKWTTDGSSIITMPGRIQAYGGGSSSNTASASAGTVFLKASASARGRLLVDNGSYASTIFTPSFHPTESLISFDELTLRNGARYRVSSGKTLELAPGTTIVTSGANLFLDVQSGGVLSALHPVTLSGATYSVAGQLSGQDITLASTLTMTGTFAAGFGKLTIESGGTFEQQNTLKLSLDSLDIRNGGVYRSGANPNPPAGYAVDWKQAMVNVSASTVSIAGSMTATSRGFPAARGPGYLSSIASHGGRAGDNGGGMPYGSAVRPSTLGSGSLNHPGGGAILLESTSLLLTGSISADGGSFVGSNEFGAAGGSVTVIVATLSGAGIISASGGDGSAWGARHGGGGGRISLEYGALGAQADPFAPGRLVANGGAGGPTAGAGTIYIKKTSAPVRTELVIDNLLSTGSGADTVQSGDVESYDRVTLRRGARYVIPNGKTLSAVEGLSGSSSGVRPYLQVATGGRLAMPSASVSISDMDIEHDGVVATVSNLTLSNANYIWLGTFDSGLGVNGVGSLTIGSGAVFEQQNTTLLDLSLLDVQAGGTYRHTAHPAPPATYASDWKLYMVRAKAATMNIAGTVTAVGQGFPTNRGPGFLNFAASHAGRAGGTGGNGGNASYGNAIRPSTLGSGGNDWPGGGAIHLEATNLSLTGSINANGPSATGAGQEGGAGGSVTLIVNSTWSGSGTISASGGSGWSNTAGAGGGRISVEYATLSAGANPFASGRLLARGGTGLSIGGAGTIYVKKTSAPEETELIIDNGLSTGSGAETEQTGSAEVYQKVSLRGGARYVIPSGRSLSATHSLSGSSAGVRPYLRVGAGGRFALPSANTTISHLDVQHDGIVATATSLTLSNVKYFWAGTFDSGLGVNGVGSLTIGSGAVFEQQNTTLLDLSLLDVQAGGTYRHTAHPAPPATYASDWKLYMVRAKAATMNIAGTVTAVGQGFPTNRGPGFLNFAASHAGRAGGNGGNASYGNAIRPSTLGSGGNDWPGGGAIHLEAMNLSLTGSISANGSSGTGAGQEGGAGGSVTLIVNSTWSGSGTISASGGNSWSNSAGAGGGRISVEYATLSSGANPFANGRLLARGGTGLSIGGAGTIYVKKTSAPEETELIIDNGLSTGSGAETEQTGSAEVYQKVSLRGGARYVIPSGRSLSATHSLSGSSAGVRPYLRVGAGGRFAFPSANTTISHLDVQHDGIVATATSLTLSNSNYVWAGTFEAGLGTNGSGSLTIGSGAVFEQQNTTLLDLTTLEIKPAVDGQAAGIYRHTANPAPPATYDSDWKLYMVRAKAATMNIAGTVTAVGQGFPTNRGPGFLNFAASHGGRAGGNGGNASYGSAIRPSTLGSGGNDWPGGGAIHLEAMNLSLTGSINANGSSGTGAGQEGGAGGSVTLIVNSTWSGSGTISASGGNSWSNSAGAGGGRISVEYGELGVGADPYASGRLAAYGGSGLTTGGAGTVYVRRTSASPLTDLIIDNRLTSGSGAETQLTDASMTLDRLTIRGGAQVRLPSGRTLSLSPTTGIFLTTGSPRPSVFVDSGAIFGLPNTVALTGLDLTVQGQLTQASNVSISYANVYYQPQVSRTFSTLEVGMSGLLELRGTQLLPVTSLNVLNGGVLTHAIGGSSLAHFVNISASSINIASGGQIHANAKGYSSAVVGTGGGTSGGVGGGGGHGGTGGAGWTGTATVNGGTQTGSEATPAHYGGVGGTGSGTAAVGGGYIKLAVCGPLVINGTLSVNGANGVNNGGGGAGGSIYVTAMDVSGAGTVSAAGGNAAGPGVNTAGAGGGGGGGGRVAIYAATNTLTLSQVVVAGGNRGSLSAGHGNPGSRASAAPPPGPQACPPGGCGSGTCAGVWRPDTFTCDYSGSNSVECEDGNLCTVGSTCQQGTCGNAEPIDCEDGNACTTHTCDVAVGCVQNLNERNGESCNDDNHCTTVDTCASGTCVGSVPPACDDSDPCTGTTCVPSIGCTYPPLTGVSCTDQESCTGPDTCVAGVCEGSRLEVDGCYDAFPGAPVIGPEIGFESVQGSPVSVDLTGHENDYEVQMRGDANGLTWAFAGVDTTLFTATWNSVAEVLTITPNDPDVEYDTTIELTLTDPDGLTDVAHVRVSNRPPDYRLSLSATPTSANLYGERVDLEARLESPTGKSVAWHLVEFEQTGAGGYLTSYIGATNAGGLAKTRYVSGAEEGPKTFTARMTLPSGETYTSEVVVPVSRPARDVAVFTLDISFHDPDTGLELHPGDQDMVPVNMPLEVRARLRNLGSEPTPALAVHLLTAHVDGTVLTDYVQIASLTTGSIPPGGGSVPSSVVISHTDTFSHPGFNLLRVSVDPLDTFTNEAVDENNVATQGFWIGDMVENVFDVVVTQCEFQGISGGVVPLGGTIGIAGRADYGPLMPFDPGGTLGFSAVRGGVVSLSLHDHLGEEIDHVVGGRTLLPVSGDDGANRALHTIGTSEAPAKLGTFPNAAYKSWDVPAPLEFGCYSLRACVSDGSFEGCCEEPFCIEPEGPDLSCDKLNLPKVANLEVAPTAGTPSTISVVIRNQGDFAAQNVEAVLLADGVEVGPKQIIASIGARSSQTVTFPWTPACGIGNLKVRIDPLNRVAETAESNNECERMTAELELTELEVDSQDSCRASVSLDFDNSGDMPKPLVGASLVVTSSTGVDTTSHIVPTTGPLRFTNLDVSTPGAYTLVATLDTPIALPATCGQAPEDVEQANNTKQFIACRDPSAWSQANKQTEADLAFYPRPFKYDEEVVVTARVSSLGVLPVISDVEAQLSSDLAVSLETDADPNQDRKTVAASCEDPISGDSPKSVSWTWVPRYRPGGGPEVRELRTILDPNTTHGTCLPTNNNTSIRPLSMNLTAELDALATFQFGNEIVFTGRTLLAPNGDIQPDDEGSDVAFALVKADGIVRYPQNDDLISPSEDAPETYDFSWTPSVVDCDVDNPIETARFTVDSNNAYSEDVGDNDAFVSLPDLVVTDIKRTVDGCASDYEVTIANKAPGAKLDVGEWDARITLTPPGGPPQVSTVTFSGVGKFEILSDVDDAISGTWTVQVEVDTASTSACGDVLERNEKNNILSKSFDLCPDPALLDVSGGIFPADGNGVTRGVTETLKVKVTNTGTKAIRYPVPVALTRSGGALAAVDSEVKTLAIDCSNPLVPGESREVTWSVDLRPSDGIEELVATLDPLGTISDECSESDHILTRPIYLDLSPWNTVLGRNFSTSRDIAGDGAAIWGEDLSLSHFVRLMGTKPGYNGRPVLMVTPGTDEGIVTQQRLVRDSGDVVVIRDVPFELPLPRGLEIPVEFGAALCDPLDPFNRVEVDVDATKVLVEEDEFNNDTWRPLTDLYVSQVSLAPTDPDFATLSFVAAGEETIFRKKVQVGEWRARAEVTRPDGTKVYFEDIGPHELMDPYEISDEVGIHQNGYYTVSVTIDPPSPDALCGEVPEANELNNTETSTDFEMCPFVSTSVEVVGKPVVGHETTVKVRLTNTGNKPLIEDTRVTLEARTRARTPIAVVLDQDTRLVEFDPANRLLPNESVEVEFKWTPDNQFADVEYFVAVPLVLDTVDDNGPYANAVCTNKGAGTGRGYFITTLDDDPEIVGCEAEIIFSNPLACADGSFGVSVVRPGTGTPLTAADVTSVSVQMTPISGDWPASATALALTATSGVWAEELEIPSEATLSLVRLSAQVKTRQGHHCNATGAALIEAGSPDLSLTQDEFRFVRLDGIAEPDITRADIGQALDIELKVKNGEEACQARDVSGELYIELGFDKVFLGTWNIPKIDTGETASAILSPNINLPLEPEILADGTIRWRVSPPSPWLNVFTATITDSYVADPMPDDNGVTRSLWVGDMAGTGPGINVEILHPRPTDVVMPGGPTNVRVRLTNDEGEPLEPDDLNAISLFALDPLTTAELAPAGNLDLVDDHVGNGEYAYVMVIDSGAPGPTIEWVAAGILKATGTSASDTTLTQLDIGEVCFELAVSDASEAGGPKEIGVKLSLLPGQSLPSPLSVLMKDLGTGDASSGIDYPTFGNTEVVFPSGSVDGTIVTVSLTPTDDLVVESPETLIFGLEGAEVCTTSHTLTIVDDDVACGCDDGNPCTEDLCPATPGGDCVYNPLPPSGDDFTCDGVDDDCDLVTDDDYNQLPVVCGAEGGACERAGLTVCIAGVESNDCPTHLDLISDLGDDQCLPETSVEVAYLIVVDATGAASGTVRCMFTHSGGTSSSTCDTESDGVTLKVHPGLFCP
jgi:hypothetical protein